MNWKTELKWVLLNAAITGIVCGAAMYFTSLWVLGLPL